MAKSIGYFGLRRGSTKSHTFSVVGGKQITKDRVEGGKNPRTPLQMRQRCVIATCAQAYKAMKAICGHAFEGVSEGRDCAMKFRERNTRQLMFAANGQNESFGFNKWGVKGMMPGSYILSDGNLDQPLPNMYVASVNANSKHTFFLPSSWGLLTLMKHLRTYDLASTYERRPNDGGTTLERLRSLKPKYGSNWLRPKYSRSA